MDMVWALKFWHMLFSPGLMDGLNDPDIGKGEWPEKILGVPCEELGFPKNGTPEEKADFLRRWADAIEDKRPAMEEPGDDGPLRVGACPECGSVLQYSDGYLSLAPPKHEGAPSPRGVIGYTGERKGL